MAIHMNIIRCTVYVKYIREYSILFEIIPLLFFLKEVIPCTREKIEAQRTFVFLG